MTKAERFKAAVEKFSASNKTSIALFDFAVSVCAATSFGSGLIFSEVKEIIEANYVD